MSCGPAVGLGLRFGTMRRGNDHLMNNDPITIFLAPQELSILFPKEIAAEIGVSAATFKARLATLGPDHYLTYFPGPIPAKTRRLGKRAAKTVGPSLSNTPLERITDLEYQQALKFLEKLIILSKRDLVRKNCQVSRAFLLNENHMLQWYLEPITTIDCKTFLERLRIWVLEVSPSPKPSSLCRPNSRR